MVVARARRLQIKREKRNKHRLGFTKATMSFSFGKFNRHQ